MRLTPRWRGRLPTRSSRRDDPALHSCHGAFTSKSYDISAIPHLPENLSLPLPIILRRQARGNFMDALNMDEPSLSICLPAPMQTREVRANLLSLSLLGGLGSFTASGYLISFLDTRSSGTSTLSLAMGRDHETKQCIIGDLYLGEDDLNFQPSLGGTGKCYIHNKSAYF